MTERQLRNTLDDFAARGIVADLWLRDDDAVLPSIDLDRLLASAADHQVPITLAVIPQPTGTQLARRLERTDGVTIAVHGYAHQNHAREAEKKRELGLHRPKSVVLDEVSKGLSKLTALYPEQLLPLLVPPWNRIDDEIAAALPALGFRAVSVFGPEISGAIDQLNTHIDVIDWRGSRGGRDHDVLFAETATRLRIAAKTGLSTGILTHHLVHDEAVWSFLTRLFALTASHPGCRWRAAGALLAASSP